MYVGGQTRTPDMTSYEAPDLELAENAQGRRGPALAVGAVGAAWVTMAVVAVTMLRPELAMVRQIAVKAAIDGMPAAVAPAAFARPPQQQPHDPQQASAPVRGWWRYTDPTGFSINLPDGWQQESRSAYQVRFTNPADPGAAIVIAYTTTPQPDQYVDWEQQSARKAQADPAYFLVSINRVYYRGYNCADWEFTDSGNGRLTHFLDHGFISARGTQANAIELIAPASRWGSIKASLWGELLASFTPADHATAAMAESPAPGSKPTHGSQQPAPTPSTAGERPSTRQPSGQPTSVATGIPTSVPAGLPTSIPTSIPSGIPTSIPSGIPTGFLSGNLPSAP
jgi:hypothetical protein